MGGLKKEEDCPEGRICKTPGMSVDSPPGHFVDGKNRKLLFKCAPKTFCPLRNSRVSNSTMCPPGYLCPEPSIGVPIQCQRSNSSNSQYCPGGTIADPFCPPGYECPTPTIKKKCEVGQFCPNGTMDAKACPSGWYCPSPEERVLCPRNYYCTAGS